MRVSIWTILDPVIQARQLTDYATHSEGWDLTVLVAPSMELL
ncbi:MAG: hypothetical protein RIG63_01105 [Coleofasciculus chthonoplastes F3-SA18-01]